MADEYRVEWLVDPGPRSGDVLLRMLDDALAGHDVRPPFAGMTSVAREGDRVARLGFRLVADDADDLVRSLQSVKTSMEARGVTARRDPEVGEGEPVARMRSTTPGVSYDEATETLTILEASGPNDGDLEITFGPDPRGHVRAMLADLGPRGRREQAFPVQMIKVLRSRR